MKVTHLDDEHLLNLSSSELALLVDMLYAGLFSDLLPADAGTRQRVNALMAQVQDGLFAAAQDTWQRQLSG
ncbi:MAG: hypothetical protein K9J72_07730 [Synechococcus sp. Tobar2m-G35]|nr:hypothetical protein [Synechococcus sp. Tobar2m-G35]